MKIARCLPLILFLVLISAAEAKGFHAPPWDTGHNSFQGDDGDMGTDPGTGDGRNSCPCTSKAMSPVEAATGNFIYSMRPLLISGLGPTINLALTYNSQDLRRGAFGVGWVQPYDQRIIETTDEVNVYAISTQPDGKRERFVRNSDGSYTPPPHVFETLTKNSDNSFALRDKYGSVRHFNSQGLLAAVADRNGNTLSFSYDSTGFMNQITDAASRTVSLTKGADGRVASLVDPKGRVLRFVYDLSANLVSYIDPLGNVTAYQYDSMNNLIAMIDPRGNTQMHLTYDSAGRVAQHMDGAETWTYSYLPSSKRTTKRDSQGNTWTFDYNDNGNVTRIVDPLGKTEQYVVDASLNVTQYTDKNGNVTKYTYDSVGNQLTATDAFGNTRTMTYEPIFNRLLSIQDALGNITRFSYDEHANLTKTTNALSQVTMFQYDPKGQLTQITDALGNSSTFTYDSYGNLIQRADALGNITTSSFDLLGKVLSSTDAEGRQTQFTYDDDERLVRTINSISGTTINEYDASSNLTAITTQIGARTTFQYDSLNRLVRMMNPLGQSATYTYSSHSTLASKTDAKGQTINYTYDPLDRLTRKTKPEGTVSYSYDSAGNILNIVESDSNLSFIYDGLNRVTEVDTAATSGQPATAIKYSFDANGNRKMLVDPAGGVTNYNYDALHRLTSLTDPSGQPFAFSYDALSRRIRVDRPLGITTAYTYDAASRLISMVHQGGAGNLNFSYTYDRVGNRTTKVDTVGAHSFSYDSLYRLTAASHSVGISESYTYDAVGNRTASHRSSTYSYNAANQLVADATFDYLYDANGNLSRKTERQPGRVTNYTYDSENQLIRVDLPDGSVASYRYDGMGRRIEKNVGGQITRYIYDGQDILFEYAGQALAARYTQGTGIDEVLSVTRGGTTSYFQADGLGSVFRVIDQGGVKASYTYDSFGVVTSQTGTSQGPYQFHGREYDQESGLLYYRARMYDPSVGRFIQQDPITFASGTLNFYGYVDNNPVNQADPSGLGGRGAWHNVSLKRDPQRWLEEFKKWRENLKWDDQGHPEKLLNRCRELEKFLSNPLCTMDKALEDALRNQMDWCRKNNQRLMEAAGMSESQSGMSQENLLKMVAIGLIAAGVLIDAGTIIEDILSEGVGTLDDPASFALGAKLINKGVQGFAH